MSAGRILRRPALALLAVLAVLAGTQAAGVILAGPAAAAQHCWFQAVKDADGTIHYVKRCREVRPGQPGGPGGGGEPVDCGLDKMTPQPGYGAYFCVGKAACTIKDNYVPYAPPTETAPPGHEWKLRLCWPCGGCFGPPVPTFILDGPAARPLIVQAQDAFGRLPRPDANVQHSPDTKAVVQLDTWFWLDPATFGVLRGTSAEGLVAVAVPQATEWNPGDGTGTFSCEGPGTPYSEGADPSQACTHKYDAMSPGYTGSAVRHWAVHYENGGGVINIPGAPADADATSTFVIPVVETQVEVGGN
ncbi:MAG TPA: hypothetical protein VMU51_26540 [Mycobacteriales bacterium]|nr:hypothetical protein [Mycobacteriales bacterium]